MIKALNRWFKDVSIKGKLFFVMSIMALLIAGELYMLYFTIHTLSATRAFVAGEGLYSKAEKDAVYSLRKYSSTLDEKDYRAFQDYIKVTLGDRQAREEMDKKTPDMSLVYAGLSKGRNHPDDIDGMIELFRKFRHVDYISKAIVIWSKGDSLISKLEETGNYLHAKVAFAAGYKAGMGIQESVERIDALNRNLTILEDDFSYTLGQGSRWLEHLILKILFLVAITVEFTGLYLTISVSAGITKGLDEIMKASASVAASNFSAHARIYSRDEIGRLASSFNSMVEQLGEKTKERDQSEEKLRQQKELYETLVIAQSEMGEGVVITEGQSIVFVNKALCDIYGYSEKELLNLPSYMDIVAEEEKERLRQIRHGRLSGMNIPERGETSICRKDGQKITIAYSRRIMEVGSRTQLISIVRDITNQKRAEKKMAELAAIVEASDDAIISATVDGKLLSWNKGAEKLYGYQADEVIGKHLSMLTITGKTGEASEIGSRVMTGEHIEQYETAMRKKDGKRVYVSLTASPIRGEDDVLSSISIIARDITGRKRVESDLKHKSDELIRSNTELEQFAYIASHDLREPLRTITSYVQLLKNRYHDQLDEEAKEFIGFTVDGAKRMDQLIQDLLTFSRVGNAKLGFEKVNTADTVAIVLDHLQEISQKEGAVITIGELPEIKANGLQMIQLFQNLLMNAIKFRGEAKPVIHVTGKKQKQGWIFSVSDNGIGIDRKYAEKIFIIFQRLHAKGQYEGTGIGLAICKKIVERHGGEIWFESEPGKGSVFYFT
ncbi:MAG TPA: PAS domain S-box protein, partial [Bacteroidia bacterium]|nr:PAS domain S-box protein [Bacteroidia bacterium]